MVCFYRTTIIRQYFKIAMLKSVESVFVFFFVALFLCCCNERNSSKIIIWSSEDPTFLDSVKNEIINNGDTALYKEFWAGFMREDREFICHYLMAEKFNYPDAYYFLADQYYELILNDPYAKLFDTLRFSSCDFASRQLILYWLAKAYYLKSEIVLKIYDSCHYIKTNIDSIMNDNFVISISNE